MAKTLEQAYNSVWNRNKKVMNEYRRSKEGDKPQHIVTETYEDYRDRKENEKQFSGHQIILFLGLGCLIFGFGFLAYRKYAYGIGLIIFGALIFYWAWKDSDRVGKKLGYGRR